MSHFTVLVIGPDPEEQLAPYHEFECTGHNDEYVVDVDQTDEVREKRDECLAAGMTPEAALDEALGWFGLEERVIADEADVDREGAHKYGYAVVRDGDLVRAVDHTNPNKKWDWYVLGGRWTGFFKLRPGCVGVTGRAGTMTEPNRDRMRCDAAAKKSIDFEAMREEEAQKARERHARFHELVAGLPWPEAWDDVVKRCTRVVGDPDYGRAREIYNAQPAVKKIHESREFSWDCQPEEYAATADEYARAAREQAVSTFAVVKDGKWYQRGEMGWWCTVTGEVSDAEWAARFNELLDSVDGETLLSVYDCHI